MEVSDSGAPVLRDRHLKVRKLIERGLGGDPGGGQLDVATEGEAGHEEDEVTDGLARLRLTVLKVIKRKNVKLISKVNSRTCSSFNKNSERKM